MSVLAAAAMFTSYRATKRRISAVVSPPSRAEAHLPAQVVSARLGRTYWASTARRSGKAGFLRRWGGEAADSTERAGVVAVGERAGVREAKDGHRKNSSCIACCGYRPWAQGR